MATVVKFIYSLDNSSTCTLSIVLKLSKILTNNALITCQSAYARDRGPQAGPNITDLEHISISKPFHFKNPDYSNEKTCVLILLSNPSNSSSIKEKATIRASTMSFSQHANDDYDGTSQSCCAFACHLHRVVLLGSFQNWESPEEDNQSCTTAPIIEASSLISTKKA